MHQQTFVDQLLRKVSINFPPKRIISIVPSQTELLFDLGLDNEIVGITKFCNHPADKVKTKPKIGGTKKLDLDLIRSLKPDLIIGNKEENERNQIETLMLEFPVWMSDIDDLDSALDMIRKVGEITAKINEATSIANQIETGFKKLSQAKSNLRIAYLIWQKPYMVAGHGTFINHMLQLCGWVNAFNQLRYPEITADELLQAHPDVIMLSSEPFPFRDKHIVAFKKICPHSEVMLVDGEMFSWYGSRLLQSTGYFKQLQ